MLSHPDQIVRRKVNEDCCNSEGPKQTSIKDIIKNKIESLGKQHDSMYNKALDLKVLLDMLPTNMLEHQERALSNILSRTLNTID